MKKTFRKITASIAAAIMCALPIANSLTVDAGCSPNALYTYRKVYYSPYNSNIDHVTFTWNINSNGTSAPITTKLVNGNLYNGGSGVPNHHIAGGTFEPSNPAVTGRIFSQSFYSDNTSITEYSNNIYVYNKNGQLVNSGVRTFPTMLVGDMDRDNDVDAFDYSLINHIINVEHYSLAKITSPHSFKGVDLNGRHYTVYSYQLDIDNDGDVDTADFTMYAAHSNGTLTSRFAQ